MSVVKRIDHISIGVEDMRAASRLLTEVLGGNPLPDAGSSPAGFDWATFAIGGKKVELVSPHVAGEGGVGRYVEKYGQGFHHMSVSVENLDDAIRHFESKGVRTIGLDRSNPNFQHFYLHPKDTFGAMIQVFEENEETLRMAGGEE